MRRRGQQMDGFAYVDSAVSRSGRYSDKREILPKRKKERKSCFHTCFCLCGNICSAELGNAPNGGQRRKARRKVRVSEADVDNLHSLGNTVYNSRKYYADSKAKRTFRLQNKMDAGKRGLLACYAPLFRKLLFNRRHNFHCRINAADDMQSGGNCRCYTAAVFHRGIDCHYSGICV